MTRPSAGMRFWSGETHDLGGGVTLVRCGGHFAGSTVLHWAGGASGRGALLASDTVNVVQDTRWVSFMRSFPNLIPLNRRAVQGVLAALEPFAFDRIYSGWWDRVCREDGKTRLALSAERYIKAIAD